jgi:hypothetical protein
VLAQNDRSVDDIIDELDPRNSEKDDPAVRGTPIDTTSQVQHIAHYDIVTYQCIGADLVHRLQPTIPV